MLGMFFSSFILTHILLDLLFLGSAEAYIRWGGTLNGYLMAGCVIIGFQVNFIIGFQVTVENVGDTFLRHSVENDQQCDRAKVTPW